MLGMNAFYFHKSTTFWLKSKKVANFSAKKICLYFSRLGQLRSASPNRLLSLATAKMSYD
jgi:hypothetical protein